MPKKSCNRNTMNRHVRRRFLVGLLTGAACLVVLPMAVAWACAPSTGQIDFDRTSYQAGQTVTVWGTGFARNNPVVLTLQPPSGPAQRVAPQAATDADGYFETSFALSSGAGPGTYALQARTDEPGIGPGHAPTRPTTASHTFRVPAPPAAKAPAPGVAAPLTTSPPDRVINGTNGNDVLNGTNGNDVINCGPGNDVVNAGAGDDVINCGAGNDRINGGSGRDRIDGQSGNDLISGNEGNDRIAGGSGDDRANGSEGNDRVGGGSGDDRVGGQSGNDRLNGDSGRDKVAGNGGNDRVGGQSGNDRVNGSSGNDRVNGGSGRDILSGSTGRDSISARDRTRDRVNCGRGRDRVSADRRRIDRVSRNCERVRRP